MANIKAKAETVKQLATRLYGVDLSRVEVTANLRGAGAAGWAHSRTDDNGLMRRYVRLNADLIAGEGYEHVLNITVPHEIAHIVCHMKPSLGRKHNPGFWRVCLSLGGKRQKFRVDDVMYAKGRTYEYTTSTGKTVRLSETRHTRLQNGKYNGFKFKYGYGMITKDSPHKLLSAGGAPVISHTATFKKPVDNNTGLSKAEQIRQWIRIAKSEGKTQDAVIATAMTNLFMPRSQAQRYVTENWNRA